MVADRRASLAALYRAERGRVARQLLYLTGEPEGTEDLTQEVFMAAFQAIDRFEDRAALTTWLHGIVVNVARNHRAKRKRRAAHEPEDDRTSQDPESIVREAQAARTLLRALDHLEEPLREVFALRFVEERPLKEVAAVLGIPLSTAHARATRAETLLRATLQVDGAEAASGGAAAVRREPVGDAHD